MRYAMVRLEAGNEHPAILEGDQVRLFHPSVIDLRAAIAMTADERLDMISQESIPLAGLTLLAPLRPPKNVFCVGRNYLAHAEESTRANGIKLDLPDVPTFFSKAPTAISGPDTTLKLQAEVSSKFDWEAELGVVIAHRCRDVSEADAMDYVFGYTCVNDISARDIQQAHVQWFKGKSLDYTCPVGPYIVGTDEITDPQNLAIHLRINGQVKQAGSTSQMIFNVPRIIAELSRGMTLEPGDLIATGTPEGVGFARNPPEYLANNDVVEVEIEGIGILRNTIELL